MSECKIYHIEKFWDDEFKTLDYIREPFNDPDSVNHWIYLGFGPKIVGEMCDMRCPQPSWNQRFIDIYESMGWRDVGTSYYRMTPGTIMPEHRDLYKAYVQKFSLQGQEHNIRRAVIFLEDWQSGHYLECQGHPVTGWRAGDAVEWIYDVPHSAANIGMTDRYTLQITGHI